MLCLNARLKEIQDLTLSGRRMACCLPLDTGDTDYKIHTGKNGSPAEYLSLLTCKEMNRDRYQPEIY